MLHREEPTTHKYIKVSIRFRHYIHFPDGFLFYSQKHHTRSYSIYNTIEVKSDKIRLKACFTVDFIKYFERKHNITFCLLYQTSQGFQLNMGYQANYIFFVLFETLEGINPFSFFLQTNERRFVKGGRKEILVVKRF